MTTHFGGIASSKLPKDQAVLAGVVEHGSWALVHATSAQRANRDFVLQAVARDGNALLYAAEELKEDREVVLTATAQDGHALRHGSTTLRADHDFALEAVMRHSSAMLFVSEELRESRDFVLEAVQKGCSLEFVKGHLKTWCLRRDALRATMRACIDSRDVDGLSKVIKDSEAHELPESDIAEARLALAKLVKFSEVDSLWEPLRPGADGGPAPVALVKGTWLLELSRRGSILPRRQDLPPEAIWDVGELKEDAEVYERSAREQRAHHVVAVSHCWLRQEHPDPHGAQLKTLSAFIERRLQELGPPVDLAVFLDYCSLFQEPRSDDEEASFKESLKSVSTWYAHEKTEKWFLTRPPETCSLPESVAATEAAKQPRAVPPYQQRGWTFFERSMAELLACEGRTRSLLIDAGRAPEDELLPEWGLVRWRCSAQQSPPRTPESFCQELAAKTFSDTRDLEVLAELYRLTFSEVAASTKSLVFCDMNWGDDEAAGLADAIQHCGLLQVIELEGNCFGDASVSGLFGAFSACSLLHRIVLRANRIGDAGARQLAAMLPGCKQLEALDLSFNVIGNAGATSLAAMFESAAHPSLRELRLTSNDIGGFAKDELRRAAEARQAPGFELHL